MNRNGPRESSGGQPRGDAGSSLSLREFARREYELVHPRCVAERQLDYEEGVEAWRAGEPEAAREILLDALSGCAKNVFIHVALGQMALDDFKNARLARGHFGYAVELIRSALARDFRGRLPNSRAANAPIARAIEGLARCYDQLKQPREAADLRKWAVRLERGAAD